MIKLEEMAHKPNKEILDYTIDEMLEYGELSFFFPFEWGDPEIDGIGGKCPEDPLTIYASIDVSGNDERITFKTTIKDLLEDVYAGYELVGGEHWLSPTNKYLLEDEGIHLFEKIKQALLLEVKRIDDWIAKDRAERNETL